MAAVSKVPGRGWIQEWYETGDPDLKTRARELRARGYRVHSESMGSQVTQWGRLKMTLLDIRPGTSGDEYLEQVNPRRNAGPLSIRKWKKVMRRTGATHYQTKAGFRKFRQPKDIRRGYLTGQPKRRNAGPHSLRKTKKVVRKMSAARDPSFDVGAWARRIKQLRKKQNPPRVKGRKVKGGRAVSLRGFTGTIVRRSDGTVNILGRGRRR